MPNSTTALALVLALAAGSAFAQANSPAAPAGAAATGCLQAGAEASPEAFSTLDDNGDGFVTANEYVEKCGKAGAAAADDETAKAQFATLDADRDGRIGPDEYKAPAQAAAGATSSDSGKGVTSTDEAQGGAALAGISAEEIVGKDVVNAKGEQLGQVRGLALDDQRTAHAIVSVGGFLGIGAKQVAIPFEQLRIGADEVTLMSETSEDELQQMPEFDEERFTRMGRAGATQSESGRPSPSRY